MPNLILDDFTWHRDPKGYRLVRSKAKPGPGQSVLERPSSAIQPARIVRNGGELRPYRPLRSPDLFCRFYSMATSEEGLMEFVEQFGPLTNEGLRGKGEHVPRIIDAAQSMRRSGSGSGLLTLNASVVREHNETRLKLWPSCLLDALWLQLAQANTQSRECEQCGEPFLAGPDTGRRLDSKFCSKECQIRFNSLKRSRP